MSSFTRFDYLLNAMQNAAQADNPAKEGYAAKRKAVLDYVAKLEAAQRSREPVAWRFKPSQQAKAWSYTDHKPRFVGESEVIEPLCKCEGGEE